MTLQTSNVMRNVCEHGDQIVFLGSTYWNLCN